MYIPNAFAEQRLDMLHELMSSHAFATLITHGPRGLIASHVPIVLLAARGEFGSLQFHLAKPNPQCDDLAAGAEPLTIFQGPHGYISPTWYTTTTTVPTWNYVTVHAYGGTPRVMDDDALREHLDTLVARYESARPSGWNSVMLPDDTFEKLRGAIVGFEVPIARLEGKWKLGQNRITADRIGAIVGLRSTGNVDDAVLAQWMEAALSGG
jgi:transcriptional regulator